MATQTRKKLEGNGFWESSRMMLPEHKLALNEHFKELKKRERVQLDDQEWEKVRYLLNLRSSRVIAESLQQRRVITLRMYHEYEDLQIVGVVDRVDQLNKRFNWD